VLARVSTSHRLIVGNSVAMVGASAVTSALGVVYWWLAARHFSAATVGFASAAISSMTLLGTIAMLGFGTMLMGELPRHPGQEGRMISSSLLAVGTAGVLLGLLFALVAPIAAPDLGPMRDGIGAVTLYAVGVGLTAMALVTDLAVLGLLRGRLQFLRNSVFALAKLIVLAALSLWAANSFGLSIYATWAAGNAISLLLLGMLALRGERKQSLRPQWRYMRSAGKTALGHHMLNLALQAPTLTYPLIVTVVLSTQANAAFYIAWMIAGFLYIGPMSLSLVLYAADAADPDSLHRKVLFTLGLSYAIGVVGEIGLVVLSGTALRFFGHSYAEQARICLPVIGAAVFGLILKDHYVTLARSQGFVLRATALIALGDVLEIVAGVVGAATAGLGGLAVGYVLALSLEAIVYGPRVIAAAGVRDIRRRAPADVEV
jgi:O-antigen/teichoic acid export membrane protein